MRVPLRPEQAAAVVELQPLEVFQGAPVPLLGRLLGRHPELVPVKAQVGVGQVPVVHIGVGVVALDQVAFPPQLLGQREVQVCPQLPGVG